MAALEVVIVLAVVVLAAAGFSWWWAGRRGAEAERSRVRDRSVDQAAAEYRAGPNRGQAGGGAGMPGV